MLFIPMHMPFGIIFYFSYPQLCALLGSWQDKRKLLPPFSLKMLLTNSQHYSLDNSKWVFFEDGLQVANDILLYLYLCITISECQSQHVQ